MPTAEGSKREVRETIKSINEIFRKGEWRGLEGYLADDIVMIFPGFAGRTEGKEAFLAGFKDMADNAKIHELEETDLQIDTFGDTAVASFAFEITYERKGQTYAGGGRDLWAFHRGGKGWKAVWRTVLDMREESLGPA